MDFSNYEKSGRYYAGSERKIGIREASGNLYMLKFPKATPFGKSFSHVSEHLGSKIFDLAGLPAQQTYLGTYKGEQVVACKDFVTNETQFVPFNDVGESTLEEDRNTYLYDYADIMRMLEENRKLTNVEETITLFWRMYIVDALIGNFDRHGANWGFLKENGRYYAAPIFDNGSCLFPRLIDDASVQDILSSEEEMTKRVYGFPTSQIRLNGKKSSYHEIISSRAFPECNDALSYILEMINMTKVETLVEDCEFISDIRKQFYLKMLELRWHLILVNSFSRRTL